jgi:hypothetical protein
MDEKDIATEIKRCCDSPYYFATRYLLIDGKPFTTHLSEEDFDLAVKKAALQPDFDPWKGRRVTQL